jgi:3'-phosphoadenosine 5'-phosphosulfate sulfotransferase (PAPS reductase)/FAD synthetase
MNCSLDQKTALLYYRLNSFQYLLQQTQRFIEQSLAKVKRPYLACSFGKDSSVMLDLVWQYKPDITVRFASHPETRLLDNYDEVIQWWLKRGINYEEIYCEGGLVKVKHHQRQSLNQGEWDSYFVGIRAEESTERKKCLKFQGMFHQLSNGRIRIAPLAWWTTRDITAYLWGNKIPSLQAYHDLGFDTRTSAGIPRTCIHRCLRSLKDRDILAFNKLCELFPDAKEFV